MIEFESYTLRTVDNWLFNMSLFIIWFYGLIRWVLFMLGRHKTHWESWKLRVRSNSILDCTMMNASTQQSLFLFFLFIISNCFVFINFLHWGVIKLVNISFIYCWKVSYCRVSWWQASPQPFFQLLFTLLCRWNLNTCQTLLNEPSLLI